MKQKKEAKVDLKQLEDTFKKMNTEKAQVGLALLEEVLVMKQTLKKMRKDIEESSLVAEYGNYKRSNPIIAGYNAMINNYSKLTRQLADLLPKDDNNYYDDFDDDGLDKYLKDDF